MQEGSAYKWSLGFRCSTNPQVAGKVFEELEESVGLTPQNLVDASRPEDAPMHKEFEWNDSSAAESWRKQQARMLITHLELHVEQVEEAPVTRAFISIQIDNTPRYESTLHILTDEDKREQMFQTALKELKSFQRKYANLTEFARIFDEINRLEEG